MPAPGGRRLVAKQSPVMRNKHESQPFLNQA